MFMKRISASAVLLAGTLSLFLGFIKSPGPAAASGNGKAVVVELFTSEGCSSCPPADALLGHLRQDLAGKNVQVVPLGFHVDYWNSLGWKDRFSSADYTRRQEQYVRRMGLDGPYTPQMVVDGASEFVGNSAGQAEHEISKAANQAAVAEVTLSAQGTNQLAVEVRAPRSVSSAVVMLAITEDNLSTKVGAGENGGRELHHAAVVRELRQLGTTHNGTFSAAVPLTLNKDWKRGDLRAVVFVQQGDGGKILGAASALLD